MKKILDITDNYNTLYQDEFYKIVKYEKIIEDELFNNPVEDFIGLYQSAFNYKNNKLQWILFAEFNALDDLYDFVKHLLEKIK
jgi:hypothetical protein